MHNYLMFFLFSLKPLLSKMEFLSLLSFKLHQHGIETRWLSQYQGAKVKSKEKKGLSVSSECVVPSLGFG